MKTSLVEYLEESVCRNIDKIAVTDGEEKITFGELHRQVCVFAQLIIDKVGMLKKQPIAIYMEKGIPEYIAIWAVLYSGNFYSTLDVTSPQNRIEKIIKTLKPALIICEKDVCKTEIFEQEEILNISKKSLEYKDVNMHLFKENYRGVIDTDPAYVLFTSGSTGEPKGVVIPHRAVIDFIEWAVEKYNFTEDDMFANQAPFYFDASVPDLYLPICVGASLLILPGNSFVFPQNIIKMLNKYKVTTLFWVPSALISMAQYPFFDQVEIPSLKKVIFCGETMPIKYLNMWKKICPKAVYVNMYGPTEATYACTYYVVDRAFGEDEILPMGKACENIEVFLLGEQGEMTKNGDVGELCIRGTTLALGYYGDVDKTRNTFIQNPFVSNYKDIIYKTGDLVKYNNVGELLYMGRRDSQIKHLGYRIELGEIETAAYQISTIKRCCSKYNQEIKEIELFCTCSELMTETEIYGELKKKLPRYMLPNYIEIIDEMPLNANGKVDRKSIKRKK